MPRDNTPLDPIPAITPERDEIADRTRETRPRSKVDRRASPPSSPGKQATGSWMLVALCLAGVVMMAGWSFMLQAQLRDAKTRLVDANSRLEVLEQRLSITDESMNQSGAALQVKLKEMEFEIRKLWDNVWKKSKDRLARHDKELVALKKSVGKQQATASKLKDEISQAQLAAQVMADQVDSASQAANQVERLAKQLANQEQALAKMTETLNAVSAANANLAKRISSSEEWVDSFNGYRTQTNRKLQALQGSVNSLQGQ